MKTLLHLYLAAIGAIIAVSFALPVLARYQAVFIWVAVLTILALVARIVRFYTRY